MQYKKVFSLIFLKCAVHVILFICPSEIVEIAGGKLTDYTHRHKNVLFTCQQYIEMGTKLPERCAFVRIAFDSTFIIHFFNLAVLIISFFFWS